jgi:hypothetical protein
LKRNLEINRPFVPFPQTQVLLDRNIFLQSKKNAGLTLLTLVSRLLPASAATPFLRGLSLPIPPTQISPGLTDTLWRSGEESERSREMRERDRDRKRQKSSGHQTILRPTERKLQISSQQRSAESMSPGLEKRGKG